MDYKKRYELLKEKYEEQSLSLRKLRNELNKRLGELSESDVHYARLKAECDSIRKLYLDYINNEDKIDEVIKELAEELALTDYQSLDSLELKIYELKKNGEWKALNDLIRESMPGGAEEAWKVIEQQQRNADAKVEQAKLELARGLSEQQRLIQQRSQWFEKMETAIESFKMQHLNDSVSHYYEILTKAAPTNWDYLIAAGRFEEDYMADYNRAMNYQLSALNTTDNDTYKATSYIIIGGIYEKLDDYSKALECYEKSLKIRLSVYGENDEIVANDYERMGQIYFAQDDCSKALEYYEKSLNIYLMIYGENASWGIANVSIGMGRVYSNQGDYSKALVCFEGALKIFLLLNGDNHPAVATSYSYIGQIYFAQNDYSKALDYFKKSLNLDLSFFGENHPEVASGYYNIGYVYFAQGDYSKALEYFEEVLKIRLSVYGENHSRVASVYNDIGEIYSVQGDDFKALDYFKKSLKIVLSVYGENHSQVSSIYDHIGEVYFAQKDYSKALYYFEESLKIRLSLFGENHPEVALSYYSIGSLYIIQGDKSKALNYYEKSLKIRLSVYGENHPLTKEIMDLINVAANSKVLQSPETTK